MSTVKLIWTSKAYATDAKGRKMRAGLKGDFDAARAERMIANGFAKPVPKAPKDEAKAKSKGKGVKDGAD